MIHLAAFITGGSVVWIMMFNLRFVASSTQTVYIGFVCMCVSLFMKNRDPKYFSNQLQQSSSLFSLPVNMEEWAYCREWSSESLETGVETDTLRGGEVSSEAGGGSTDLSSAAGIMHQTGLTTWSGRGLPTPSQPVPTRRRLFHPSPPPNERPRITGTRFDRTGVCRR